MRDARAQLGQLASRWGCPEETVHSAQVVLSELISNGVLHARTELLLVISLRDDGGLRVEVHDASSSPVLPPLTAPDKSQASVPPLLDDPEEANARAGRYAAHAATGRGLSMVDAVASDWGWFPDSTGGKVVWAELAAPVTDPQPATRRGRWRATTALRPVRLIAVPLRLLKASEDHFDDLFRELQMAHIAAGAAGPAGGPARWAIGRRGGRARSPGEGPRGGAEAIAASAEGIRDRLARVRQPMRRAIWDAAVRGDRLLDLNLLTDTGTPEVFQMSENLMSDCAEAARLGLVLTEPPAPEVGAWRLWLHREVEGQIGGRPPRACPFPVAQGRGLASSPRRAKLDAARRGALDELRAVLSREGAGLPGEGAALSREGAGLPGEGAVLSHEGAGLPGEGRTTRGAVAPGAPAPTAEDVLAKALHRLLSFTGARRGALCMLSEDNETVTFGASVGFSASVAEYWHRYSLSADLPASEAIRTATPVISRTLAELDERYPAFVSTPVEDDPCFACLPLVPSPGSGAIGCLVLGFAQSRDFSPSELGLLEQMSSEVAAFIAGQRARVAQSQDAERRSALRAARGALRAAPTKGELYGALAHAAVALATDGATVYDVEENGTLHFVTTRHQDPEREAAAVQLLQNERDPAAAGIADECVRTGTGSLIQYVSEEAILAEARDDTEAELRRKLGTGSVGVLPVTAGGAVVGVLSFGNKVGRFITESDLDVLGELVTEAGHDLGDLMGAD